MTRSENMEHVEVLRHMKETIKAIMPSEVAALDAAIASLSAPQPPADAHCTTCSCVPGMTPAVRFDATPAEKDGAVRDHLIRMGWTPPAEAQAVACDEDRFEQFLQAAIARSPEPLRELGEYLAGVLDDDQWPAADRLLLQLATAPPSAPVGVEGHYHPCTSILIEGLKRLGGGSDVLEEWDRARVKADNALAQQPAACVGCEGKPSPENTPCAVCGQQPAAVDGVRGLVAKWREEATAYVVRANEKDKSGGFRWAGWMRDELRSKAGVCKRHADELESALAGQQGGSDNDR